MTPKDEQSLTQLNLNPINWTSDDVHHFVLSLVGTGIAQKFRAQEIDGKALEYLRIETLVDVLEIKLGFAARIKREFENLVSLFHVDNC